MGVFSLTMDFLSVKENLWWRCTVVYGSNERSLKPAFWEELRTCMCSTNIPWVVCRDFNAIFSIDDKRGGDRNLMDIRAATGFLQDMMLLEPPTIGRGFTWTNGQEDPIWVKLDRFLISFEWTVNFPKIIQKCLPRMGSDHVPIWLEVGMHLSKPRPFRFELAWTTIDGFQDRIAQWWNSTSPEGCGAFVMAKNVSALREQLRRWAKFSFGSIKLKKLELLYEIDKLDIIKDSPPLLRCNRNRC